MPEKAPPNESSVPQRIVDLLEAEGIRTVFGIPDPVIQHILRYASDKGFDVIAPHHEAAGAFMADAMSRMTGRPAVICGNMGPGVANLLPAAVCAAKEKIPVIFLAGQRARRYDSRVRRSQFQYTHQLDLFQPIVKYAGVIEFPEQVDDVMHEAFRISQSGTPGPVYVELPEDHNLATLPFGPVSPPEQYRVVHQSAPPEAVRAAVEVLSAARSPIMLVGTGVHTSRTQPLVTQLARRLGCPVLPTWGGRGVLPESDDQVLIYSSAQANAAIAEADVVLAVGTSIGETVQYGQGRHWARGNTDRRWICIERDPNNVGVNRPIDVALIGDLRDVVPQLVAALESSPGPKPVAALPEWRAALLADRKALFDAAPDTRPIHPGRMMLEVTRAIPENTVFVRDGGCTALWDLGYHELRCPDYLWTSKFGHLGTGLPYAIGAQLAVGSERRVCLVTGDSAFQFHLSELETAVRKKLPIVCVINYDAAWGMEHMPAFAAFGENRDVEVRWGGARFDRIAEAYGAHGGYVESTADIAPAIRRAFECGRTAVVQIVVDPRANVFEAPNWEEFSTWYGGDY
ncbi:MAG: thiamine pyrophosphate-binding protein [Pseudomonadales bacterium]